MKTKHSIELIALTLIGLILIAGCSTPANAQPVATTFPTDIPTDNVPTPLPPAPNVTLSDNGKTITLQSGQSFLLRLGENYDWTVTVADQSILKRVMNVMVIRGAQGIYMGGKPGITVLTALGDPMCLQNKPACAAPSIQFKITIIVK